jgi:hypothetical protein
VRRYRFAHFLKRSGTASAAVALAGALTSCGSTEPRAITTVWHSAPMAAQASSKAATGHAREGHASRSAVRHASAWILRARRAYERGTYIPLRRHGHLSLGGASQARKELLHAQRILSRWSSPIRTATRAALTRLGRLATNPRHRRLQAFAINASLAVLVQATRGMRRH